MAKQLSYHQNQFSKWLLAVSLLFSSLTFSGYIDNLPPQPQKTTQIEQLLSGNDGSRKVVSYPKALKFSLTQKVLSSCIREQKYALLFYDKVDVGLHKTISERTLSFDQTQRIIQNINIHKNSKEEPIPFQLG